MTGKAKLEVYYDGACGFCRWTRDRIEPWDSHGRLRFLDYNDPQIAASSPYPPEELGREMHVRAPDGSWASGFAAWLMILRVLPRWAWLGRLLGLPPLRWLGPGVYGWIARHRDALPGAPAACRPPAGSMRSRPAR